jgi:Zn-dependent peptidase ImmA (M78 family)/transcriptional regulator with XRE-family HTH domain
MQPKLNPEMLRLARESRGLNRTDLAELVGLSQSAISRLEGGETQPTAETLGKLAIALKYLPELFSQTEIVLGTGCSFLFHRQRRTMPIPEQRRIAAKVNILRIQVERLIRDVEFDFHNRFELIDPEQHKGPEGVARAVRCAWCIPAGPISNVVGILESAGAIVLDCAFGNPKVDAISQWPPNLLPLFFVNTGMPGDRQRFTLAHELGHLIMHSVPREEIEDEANAFAGEFLMPGEEIGPSLSNLTIEKAAALKSFWRVSMQAIIMRAKHLGKITSAQYTRLCQQMAPMRMIEPVPIPREQPALLRKAIGVHLKTHEYTVDDLSRFAMVGSNEFCDQFVPDPTMRLRLVR